MWQKLRRFYYENKAIIIKTAIIVVLTILIIQGINYYVGLEAKQYSNISINNQFTYGNLINFENNTSNSIHLNGVTTGNNTGGNANILGEIQQVIQTV